MISERGWFDIRQLYLESNQDATVYSIDHIPVVLSYEMLAVVDSLNTSETKRLIGIDKRQRRYLCPWCHHAGADYGNADGLKLANLIPNNSTSKNIYCFSCKENYVVVRENCPHADCKGNVLDREENMICLTCGHYL